MNEAHGDRYLWNPEADTNREIAQLEERLRSRRQSMPVFRPRAVIRRRLGRRITGFGVAVLALTAIVMPTTGGRPGDVRVDALIGTPRVVEWPSNEGSPTDADRSVETDARSRARITVGRVATVTLGPDSRLSVLGLPGDQRELALAHGALTATMRREGPAFALSSPLIQAIRAADDQCAIRLDLDRAGAGVVNVRRGTLELDASGRRMLLPAGTVVRWNNQSASALPFPDVASREFRELVGTIDARGLSPARLTALLALSDRASTITLYYLLPSLSGDERDRAIARIAALVPPPVGITRTALARLDAESLAAWEPSLRRAWGAL